MTIDPRPDLTKDAVLALADELKATRALPLSMLPGPVDKAEAMLRRLAPLLDVTREEGLWEQIAAVLSDALLNEYGARMDLVDELAGRIAPLIAACIAQARAEGAAAMRENCATWCDDNAARRLALSTLIKSRLLGIRPEDQDLVLDDADWMRIVAALEAEQ